MALFSLPNELIHQVLAYLGPEDLARVGQVCRLLSAHAADEKLWQAQVNANLAAPVRQPDVYGSFRKLYATHHPRWFLPRHRIWFSDGYPFGKLLIARFEPSTGLIAAYTVVATRGSHVLQTWDRQPRTSVYDFQPQVSLDLEMPIVVLDGKSTLRPDGTCAQCSKETYMNTQNRMVHCSFVMCQDLPPDPLLEFVSFWPPLVFPAETRVRKFEANQSFRESETRNVSQHHFRVRRWPHHRAPGEHWCSHRLSQSLDPAADFTIRVLSGMLGDRFSGLPGELNTFSTLPASLYTPTAEKPWQGIWVGDYGGHGREFVLITQPDRKDERQLPHDMDKLQDLLRSRDDSSAIEDASQDVPLAGGRLEAIKLTGDINVPRGEYTFIAPEIGNGGLIRIADESLFRGARIVQSMGHIAEREFVQDCYIPTQLIMISHNRLAQYWESFRHVSYYQRINLEALETFGL
ncbi:hypothetical protein K470DRAFT_274629 [Piedraia hortae CBS 480.64]|uniref:F-box domain-containing protein n=1 Tax=Piedraia hortae CBS 480.64 TaxID=1314780 RepID=A0A6A7C8J8_9PEZI|nr:hypothetical protein K470DRAFT_274629 [Piedraia hortae CBS 480.64]